LFFLGEVYFEGLYIPCDFLGVGFFGPSWRRQHERLYRQHL